MLLALALLGIAAAPSAHADALARGTAAFYRGDYIRAARELSPLARARQPEGAGIARLHV